MLVFWAGDQPSSYRILVLAVRMTCGPHVLFFRLRGWNNELSVGILGYCSYLLTPYHYVSYSCMLQGINKGRSLLLFHSGLDVGAGVSASAIHTFTHSVCFPRNMFTLPLCE